jgi:hypothetical protein
MMRIINFKGKILSSLRRVKKSAEDLSSALEISSDIFDFKLENPYDFTENELNILAKELCFIDIRYLISGTELFCDNKYRQYLSQSDIEFCEQENNKT